MKKNRIALLILVCILISFPLSRLFSQNEGNAGSIENRQYLLPDNPVTAQFIDNKTMIFEVRALANAKADGYLAIFNLTQVGATTEEVNSLLTERYDAFVKEALAANIKRENIVLDMISQIPIYEYETTKKLFSKSFNEVPKGIELQKNIHVLLDRADQLDQVVAAAAKSEIYDLIKVEYFVNDSKAYYTQLRKESVVYLKEKLKDFKELGGSLDSAHQVITEHSEVIYPFDRYQRYMAFSTTSLQSQKKNTEVSEIRKPETRYYNKVGYSPYDIVLNPIILEPAIQFTYHLRVKYTISEPVPKVRLMRQKEFLLLTPEGNLQQLKIE